MSEVLCRVGCEKQLWYEIMLMCFTARTTPSANANGIFVVLVGVTHTYAWSCSPPALSEECLCTPICTVNGHRILV